MKDIRTNIEKYIRQSGITQAELCRSAGISYGAFNQFMTGAKSSISFSVFISICRGLDLPPEELMSGKSKLRYDMLQIERIMCSFNDKARKRAIDTFKYYLRINFDESDKKIRRLRKKPVKK